VTYSYPCAPRADSPRIDESFFQEEDRRKPGLLPLPSDSVVPFPWADLAPPQGRLAPVMELVAQMESPGNWATWSSIIRRRRANLGHGPPGGHDRSDGASEEGLPISQLPARSEEEALQAADFYLSIIDNFRRPRVSILEAMASGLPVVIPTSAAIGISSPRGGKGFSFPRLGRMVSPSFSGTTWEFWTPPWHGSISPRWSP